MVENAEAITNNNTQESSTDSRLVLQKEPFLWLMASLPVLIYFIFVITLSVNAPFGDDFDNVLNFLSKFYESDNLADRAVLLISQHNEHRHSFSYISYLLQFKLLGHIDFLYLIVFGNLAILGMALLYIQQVHASPYIALLALTIVLLVFQLQSFQSMFWAMAAISNYYVLFFAFLCFALLSKLTPAATGLAAVFAVMSTFTQINGLMVFPAALVLLFLKDWRKVLKPLIIFEIVGLACLAVYFFDYQFSISVLSTKYRLFAQPLEQLKNTLFVLGSGFSYNNKTVGVLSGLFIVVAALALIRTGYHRQRPALSLFFVFLVLSVITVSLSRVAIGDAMAASRYRVLSIHCWVVVIVGLLEVYIPRVQQSRLIAQLIIAVSIMAFTISYAVNVKHVLDQRTLIRSFVSNWMEYGYVWHGQALSFDAILTEAVKRGFYEPFHLVDKSRHPLEIKAISCKFQEQGQLRHHLTISAAQKTHLIAIKGWFGTKVKGSTRGDKQALIFCQGDSGYKVTIPKHYATQVPEQLRDNHNKIIGVDTAFLRRKLAPGRYRVGIYMRHKRENYFQWTADQIEVPDKAIKGLANP